MEQRPKAWYLAAIIAVSMLPLVASFGPVLEHDTWWHLAIGRWMVESLSVPTVDPLCQSVSPWIAYSWLYEIVMYEAFSLGGIPGVLLLRGLLVALSTAMVAAYAIRRGGVSMTALAAMAAIMLVLQPFAVERPWHFTIAFTTLTLWNVQALRGGSPIRKAWWLPLLFALWANLHIQFVLGLAILGLSCLFPGRANRLQLLLLSFFCFLATACNPYQFAIYRVALEYATHSAPIAFVDELHPPEPWARSTLAAAALLIFAGRNALRHRDAFEIALLIAAFLLALRMRRDLWFVGLACLSTFRAATPVSIGFIAIIASIIASLILAFRLIESVMLGAAFDYDAAQQARFPHRAMQAVLQHRPAGPLYNHFDWGGYLAWQLPEHKPSIDGRTNLHGDDHLRRSFETWNGDTDDGELQTAKLVIAPANRVLTAKLRDDPAWTILHEDEICVVFVK